MANLINQKFLQNIDSTKFHIAQNGALMGVNSQGQPVEVLKLSPADQVLLLGVQVANQTELDDVIAALTAEVSRAKAAEASLSGRIGHIEAQQWKSFYYGYLKGQDIANQYIDLPDLVLPNTLFMVSDMVSLYEGIHFSTSVVNGKTRVTFMGEVAQGGDAAFNTGDDVFFKYQHE